MAGSFQADFSSVVFLAALFGCCWSVNPGLRTALTSKGLNYGEWLAKIASWPRRCGW